MRVKKRTSIGIFVIVDVLIAAVSAIMPFVLRFGIFYVGLIVQETVFGPLLPSTQIVFVVSVRVNFAV